MRNNIDIPILGIIIVFVIDIYVKYENKKISTSLRSSVNAY